MGAPYGQTASHTIDTTFAASAECLALAVHEMRWCVRACDRLLIRADAHSVAAATHKHT